MSPKELDLAIERLLEERPNEEKPVRRRRNKFKDELKQARRGDYRIPESVLREILGEDSYKEIEYVEFVSRYEEKYVGTVNGWYDDIKDISEELGVHPDRIRLEKITYYDVDKDIEIDDGESNIYLKGYLSSAYFYDKEWGFITSIGGFRAEWRYDRPPYIEGAYKYTESIRKEIKGYYGKSPNKKYKMRLSYYQIIEDLETHFKGHEGKYDKYRILLKELDKSNCYNKTIPIPKGNVLGAYERLMRTVNGHDTYHEIDFEKEAIEYEDAVRHYEYEYYW